MYVRHFTEIGKVGLLLASTQITATLVALNEQPKFLFQRYINKITCEMNHHFNTNKYELVEVLKEIY